MLTQLQTPIPILTPKGRAWAVAIIDYGPHWDLQWVTFVRESGECWTFRNSEIRQEKNYTFGLPEPTSPELVPMRPVAPRNTVFATNTVPEENNAGIHLPANGSRDPRAGNA